jgi:hypothetical protein
MNGIFLVVNGLSLLKINIISKDLMFVAPRIYPPGKLYIVIHPYI